MLPSLENPFNYYQPDKGNFKGLVLNCNIKLPIGYLMVESNKDIHIVFQVLNFIFGSISEPHNLSADEKILLIALARHKGIKGIYPSIPTLARELQRHRTSVIDTLKKLEEKMLIMIDKNKGKSNHYELCTGSSVYTTGSAETTSSVHPTTPVVSTLTTSSVHTTQSIKINNTDKVIERERKKRAPLSDSFLPSEKMNSLWQETALKSGKSKEQLLAKFKNLQKSKDGMSADWDAEFENFLINEKPAGYLNGHGSGNGEVKSTVKFLDDPDHPNHEQWKHIQEITIMQEKQKVEVEAKPKEHLSFMERKRIFELNKQHGELNNGNISNNTGRSGNS